VKAIIGCEYSGAVREAFRDLGHEAWSCDILPAEDGSEFHCQERLEAMPIGYAAGWDIGIFFPPCTDLCSSGARWFEAKRADGRQQASIDFFMYCVELVKDIGAGAIENPVGIMSRLYRKADQIVNPWWFGHGETKATCLWLHNLPPLVPTDIVSGREARIHRMSPGPDRGKERSRTYSGLARAMATQWSTK
jgi:hypothetical protein